MKNFACIVIESTLINAMHKSTRCIYEEQIFDTTLYCIHWQTITDHDWFVANFWHGIILHYLQTVIDQNQFAKQNFDTTSYCIICRRSSIETFVFSTTRSFYSLIASTSVNSLPAFSLIASEKSDNFASASDHSESGAAFSTLNSFVSASDRSGSGAAVLTIR